MSQEIQQKVDKKITFILNWKSSGSAASVRMFFEDLLTLDLEQERIIIAMPFVYLSIFQEYSVALERKNIFIASQDISCFEKEEITGEITAKMLIDLGIRHSIIGHSERRFFIKEDLPFVSQKAIIALKNNISPIFCIGEDLEHRLSGRYKEFLSNEISFFLDRIAAESFSSSVKIIIAYEPIWCIGKGITPTREEIDEIFNITQGLLSVYSEKIPLDNIDFCYGGSVNGENISQLLGIKKINHFLIGKAGKNLENLSKIINNARSTN
jgi:triosephosphate isomerase